MDPKASEEPAAYAHPTPTHPTLFYTVGSVTLPLGDLGIPYPHLQISTSEGILETLVLTKDRNGQDNMGL